MKKKRIKYVHLVLIILMLLGSQLIPLYNLENRSEPEVPKVVVNVESFTQSLVSAVNKTIDSVVYVECDSECGNWSGSGVVISKDGLILTAGHVLENPTEVRVKLNNGKEYKAVEYKHETIADVGLIKIEADNLYAVELGDSDELLLGQNIFAIGAPYGEELFPSVSSGIVSGIGRHIEFFGDKKMFQIDAPINPGNSGGPVFNLKGEVVGLTIGIIRYSDGIGFCIPSNFCEKVVAKYIANKELHDAR